MAAAHQISAQAVLQNFMLERLLERISVSKYRDKFVLKGGMLIASLVGLGSRSTMDMDATLKGYPLSEEMIERALADICAVPLDDGVTLVLDRLTPIRDDDAYGGYRVALLAEYENIKTPLKMDLTTGDRITPEAIPYSYASSFEEDKKIEILAYNIETILAEKLETILRRGVLNTRPRDFYDVYILFTTQGAMIDRELLTTAVQATTAKRMSEKALENGQQTLLDIKNDSTMRQRWDRYCREYVYARDIPFDKVIGIIQDLVQVSLDFLHHWEG